MNTLYRVLALLLLIPALQPAPQAVSLPLVIVVRDGAGNPLPGVAVEILVEGPPHEAYDTCVTDAGGQCRLMIPPGAYVIRFIQGWRGLEFAPPDEQNAGALDDGTTGGGFGVYFEPSGEEQVVTFVVGVRDGLLVPLWDMSRDPTAPPQPFAMPQSPLGSPEEALEGIDLSPLMDEQGVEDTPEITPAGDVHAVSTRIDTGASPAATPGIESGQSEDAAGAVEVNETFRAEVILLGLAGLAVVIVLLLSAMVASRRLRLNRPGKGR